MHYQFKIRLLTPARSETCLFNSNAKALEHARSIAQEDEKVNTRLIITRSDQDEPVTNLSCPAHGILDYLENFSRDTKSNMIPCPEHRRRAHSKANHKH